MLISSKESQLEIFLHPSDPNENSKLHRKTHVYSHFSEILKNDSKDLFPFLRLNLRQSKNEYRLQTIAISLKLDERAARNNVWRINGNENDYTSLRYRKTSMFIFRVISANLGIIFYSFEIEFSNISYIVMFL